MNSKDNKRQNMVWHLLKRNISAGQLSGYALSTFVGLAILSVALQFYRDVISLWHDEDRLFGENYIVLSKRVSGLGGLLGDGNSAFSVDEIKDIERQPWTRKVREPLLPLILMSMHRPRWAADGCRHRCFWRRFRMNSLISHHVNGIMILREEV